MGNLPVNDAPQKKPTRIACIGECMVELSNISWDNAQAKLDVAGDTLNSAIYLARLLPKAGFEVSFLTRIGQDNISSQVLRRIEGEGIDTSYIGRDPDRNTGLYVINVDACGERTFTYWRSQSAAREMFSKMTPTLSDLGSFDVVFLSAITLAILPTNIRAALIAACGSARDLGRLVVFDSNYRPALWESAKVARQTIDKMWAHCSIALPSLDDERKLHSDLGPDDVLDRIAKFGVAEIVLKSASDGPLLWPRTAAVRYAMAKKVVDTTGAGDAFDAGYLAARLVGKDMITAAQRGHELALKVISRPGAVIPSI